MDDATLLAAFARDKSQDAFNELVRRHVGMVYAVCRRQLVDTHWAEDVTQAVFILLARKAADLPPQVIIGGWLYKAAVFACSNARAMKNTRAYHENLVIPMKKISDQEAVEQAEIEGLLDQGLMALNRAQREVLVLRFFEKKPLAQVAKMRKKSLYATQKTLNSALAGLRRFLEKRGIAATALLLAALLTEQSARAAAPTGLAVTVGTAALGQGPALSAYVSHLATYLVKHAARAKLLGSMAVTAVLFLIGISIIGLTVASRAAAPIAPALAFAPTLPLTEAQQAPEIAALWDTLHRTETALRTMDTTALSQVVAFTNPRQAANWDLMARVFSADRQLKQAALAKFGQEGQSLTAIKTFSQRLDEVLPQVDQTDLQWDVQPDQAALHFTYRDLATRGATLHFLKIDGQWKIDATRTIDLDLEGLNSNQTRVAMQDLTLTERDAVVGKMDLMEQLLARVTQRIETDPPYNLTQARTDLQTADSQSAARAFFHLELRFDAMGQVRN